MSHRNSGFTVFGTKATESGAKMSHRTAVWDNICGKIS
ncbi:hypothetical protein B4065_0229 [Caldibacillus thermoamylovorans]|nr:hypothetical protein B4065_0229 [Caldibacillus thermoamylovorans]